MRFFFHASALKLTSPYDRISRGYTSAACVAVFLFFGNKWRQTKFRDGYDRNVGTRKIGGKNVKFGLLLHTIEQGCQHWMRVRREICEGRPLPAYKVAQVQKKADERGGNSDTFFSDLKIFASILQAPTSKFLPRFCRHIVGVPFVHRKPLIIFVSPAEQAPRPRCCNFRQRR